MNTGLYSTAKSYHAALTILLLEGQQHAPQAVLRGDFTERAPCSLAGHAFGFTFHLAGGCGLGAGGPAD